MFHDREFLFFHQIFKEENCQMTELEWMKIFGENLAEIMGEQGYTQRDLARATNLSESAISNYVRGRQMPTLRAIINIGYELGVDFNDFIDFGDRIE